MENKDRKITIVIDGEQQTYIGTLEGVFVIYPNARIVKIEYDIYEKWKNVSRFPGYKISNKGRFQTKTSGKWVEMKPWKGARNSLVIVFRRDGKSWQRGVEALVKKHFKL